MLFGIPTQTIVVGGVCLVAGGIGGYMYGKSSAAADLKKLNDLNDKNKIEIAQLTADLSAATAPNKQRAA